jgi:hypothetical protein
VFASLVTGFGIVTILAGIAMGGPTGGIYEPPAVMFAGGALLALAGVRLRIVERRNRAAARIKGMWSARD